MALLSLPSTTNTSRTMPSSRSFEVEREIGDGIATKSRPEQKKDQRDKLPTAKLTSLYK